MKLNSLLFFFFLIGSFNGFSQNWNLDLEHSKKIASEQNKNIILVFSGSDWCGPCIKLDKDIWQSNEFVDFAETEMVLLKADFPRKKKNKLSKEQQLRNDKLAERYNKNGYFPFVVVINPKGEVLGQIAFEKKFLPKDYINFFSNL